MQVAHGGGDPPWATHPSTPEHLLMTIHLPETIHLPTLTCYILANWQELADTLAWQIVRFSG